MMKLLTRDTDYALRAIIYIVKANGKIVSTTDIENELGLPRPFLRKILQTLKNKNILSSTKGNRGGFRLCQPPGKITLVQVIEIFQGNISLLDCVLRKKVCPEIAGCPVRKKIKTLETDLISQLKGITISSLIQCR